MKALSLWQPWAHLIRIGAKRIETRSWSTTYRGPLFIHAARKRPTREVREMCYTEPFYTTLGHNRPCEPGEVYPVNWGWYMPTMSYGKIVARCRLVDVVRITADNSPPGNERFFGDYTPGRFAWMLDDIEAIRPLDCIGARGLFDVEVPESMIHAGDDA